ncbi:MAG: FKBP-type peptidyl-prolyl cis-trans isomerase [Pseudomonadota bacterium]
MSEVTAVPIAPTKRSWLVWLGLGIALAVIVGVSVAWSGTSKPVQAASFCKPGDFKGPGAVQRLASGVAVQTIKPGAGARPGPQDFVLIGYKGMLRDGTVFDSAPRAPLQLSEVVPGFSQGLQTMQPGGSYRLCIPPELGYGERSSGPIPANSTLFFDIELLEFKTVREVQAMQQQMQAMQQQMQQQGQPAPGQ